MSRSRKKHPFIKCPSFIKKYWRKIRRVLNQETKEAAKLVDPEEYEITDPNSIVNEYDVHDYVFYCPEDERFYRK